MLIASVNEARRLLEEADRNFQLHVLVSGQDIDQTALLMAYIQLSLLGVAGYFKVGNSLTDPMRESDSLENYWFTPIYFSNSWVMRRIIEQANNLEKGDADGNSG